MRCGSRHLLDWKRFDVVKLQCAISQKTLMLGRYFSGLVRELPGRIGEHRCKPPLIGEAQQIKAERVHDALSCFERANLHVAITVMLQLKCWESLHKSLISRTFPAGNKEGEIGPKAAKRSHCHA